MDDNIVELLTSTGIASAFALITSTLAVSRIKTKHAKEISRLDGKIDAANITLSNYQQILAQTSNIAQTQRIESIRISWNIILSFRQQLGEDIYKVFDSITVQKWAEYLKGDDTKSLNKVIWLDEVYKKFPMDDFRKAINSIASVRPFLGEQLALDFHIVFRFLFSLYYVVEQILNDNTMLDWKEDILCKQTLSKVLSSEDIDRVFSSNISARAAVEMIDLKIMKDVNDILSGKVVVSDSLENLKTEILKADSYLLDNVIDSHSGRKKMKK